jgi:hypothetical protein
MDTELTLADPIGDVFELERARMCDRQEWRIEHHLVEHQLEEDRTRMRQLSSPGALCHPQRARRDPRRQTLVRLGAAIGGDRYLPKLVSPPSGRMLRTRPRIDQAVSHAHVAERICSPNRTGNQSSHLQRHRKAWGAGRLANIPGICVIPRICGPTRRHGTKFAAMAGMPRRKKTMSAPVAA